MQGMGANPSGRRPSPGAPGSFVAPLPPKVILPMPASVNDEDETLDVDVVGDSDDDTPGMDECVPWVTSSDNALTYTHTHTHTSTLYCACTCRHLEALLDLHKLKLAKQMYAVRWLWLLSAGCRNRPLQISV